MKDIKFLVPDLEKAIAKGAQFTAEEISFKMRFLGPYWTGTFRNSIDIAFGGAEIPRTVSEPSESQVEGARERRKTDKSKPPAQAVKAPNPTGLYEKMYKIGSGIVSEAYVNISCDLRPDGPRDVAVTADPNWWSDYFSTTSELGRDIKFAFKEGMKTGGFA